MNGRRARRPVLTLTMGQMMKLVALTAAASLCLVPIRPLLQAGVVNVTAVLLVESIAMPLAMAMAAFLVVRPGPTRDGLILALVTIALTDALGVAAFLFAQDSGIPGVFFPFIFLVAVILILGMPLLLILLYITPTTCPRCERSRLFPAATFRPGPGSLLRRTYRCGSCEARFWNDQGRWRPVPTEPTIPIR